MFANAHIPMYDIFLSKMIFVRLSHPEKAKSSIVVTLSGNVICLMFLLFANAALQIVFIVGGILKLMASEAAGYFII